MDHYANLLNMLNTAPTSFSYNFGNSYNQGSLNSNYKQNNYSSYNNYDNISSSNTRTQNVYTPTPSNKMTSNKGNYVVLSTNYSGLTYSKITDNNLSVKYENPINTNNYGGLTGAPIIVNSNYSNYSNYSNNHPNNSNHLIEFGLPVNQSPKIEIIEDDKLINNNKLADNNLSSISSNNLSNVQTINPISSEPELKWIVEPAKNINIVSSNFKYGSNITLSDVIELNKSNTNPFIKKSLEFIKKHESNNIDNLKSKIKKFNDFI